MTNHLAIIACSKGKIWDYFNDLGPVEAGCAYSGPEFLLAKHYVSKLSDRIIILSAKYGFLDLRDIISGFYDITFARKEDKCIDSAGLYQQAREKELFNYKTLTIVANQIYQNKIYEVFAKTNISIDCPVKGIMDEKKLCIEINKLILRTTFKTANLPNL